METSTFLLVIVGGVLALFALFPRVNEVAAQAGLLIFPSLPIAGGARVSQGFKPGEHSAIDFACAVGTPLVSVADGVVVQVSDDIFQRSGRFVIVKGHGLFSTLAWSYSHMSVISCRLGQELVAGEELGLSGNTGDTRGENGGAHLHFAVLAVPGFTFLDPTPFLGLDEGAANG